MTRSNKELIAALESALAALKKEEKPAENTGMPWFYPENEEDYFYIEGCGSPDERYTVMDTRHVIGEDPYKYPAIRTEEQADRIAWARGEADRWRAMGIAAGEGEWKYYIDPNGEFAECHSVRWQSAQDALFPTRKAAEKALTEFGGIEHLQKVRRGLWGLE